MQELKTFADGADDLLRTAWLRLKWLLKRDTGKLVIYFCSFVSYRHIFSSFSKFLLVKSKVYSLFMFLIAQNVVLFKNLDKIQTFVDESQLGFSM